MKLQIELSKPNKWKPLAWLIMLCEGSKYSHASISLWADSLDRTLIYQATGSGVHFIGQAAFDLEHVVVDKYCFDISPEAKTKVLQWAIDNCGKPYGRIQLLGLGLKRLVRLLGFKMKNPFASGKDNYICCKLAAAALDESGFCEFANPDEIDLNDFKDILDKITKKE